MITKEEDFPSKDELVIGTVRKINPNSGVISLDEYYEKKGLLEVSEITKKWVRDIRKWLQIGQKDVYRVLEADEEKAHIVLSKKRVSTNERKSRLRRWKRDKKGEQLLRKLAEECELDFDTLLDKVGFTMQEKFSDLLEPFQLALSKGKEPIKRKLGNKWAKLIEQIARARLERKKYVLRGELKVQCHSREGAAVIRDLLSKQPFEINYLAAPIYQVKVQTEEPKKSIKDVESSIQELRSKIEEKGGKCSFEWKD